MVREAGSQDAAQVSITPEMANEGGGSSPYKGDGGYAASSPFLLAGSAYRPETWLYPEFTVAAIGPDEGGGLFLAQRPEADEQEESGGDAPSAYFMWGIRDGV